ncbi:hypothetical protein DL766_002709 [Monosporascus sp. MC13-8B]|uniref:Cerato-platanin n=1 Tax=Monosporascus cannonballus TaxID=155416 RepID=A0ABY0HIJ1_9PEZI|nr:hypothetical protein DL762_000715 [Monosporascus cannonballus]RYO98002.1 hypothetical protein DL763_002507 [Monosporascus cannonballus]RYP34995.1 hypothetical protein DL766_002709 [Monosporascus sp. MC13-8B]
MLFSTTLSLLSLAAAGSAATLPAAFGAQKRQSGSVSVTPHDRYSSSVGVLGCKINVNRVAYWPSFPSCNDICVRVSANGRSVNLLKIDQSGGAFDISYDAWNYLVTGQSATENPTMGGGIQATYETVDPSECADLLNEPSGRLAFTAANSMNFIGSCGPDTWVGRNNVLYNILNPVCTYGYDEVCTLPPPELGNQPQCPHQLGVPVPLSSRAVWNIDYGTGRPSLAV